MVDTVESKNYSWEFVTASRVLCNLKCELVGAYLVPSDAAADATLYDGEGISGSKIITLESEVKRTLPFNPNVPVYCSRGLYLSKGENVTGVLVIWRGLK